MQRVHPERMFFIKEGQRGAGPVIYWMSRDQRVQDNWALIYAQDTAIENERPLTVLFCLTDQFSGATRRAYAFMLEGLRSLRPSLEPLGISFELLIGNPAELIPTWTHVHDAFGIITDFDPLRIKQQWKVRIMDKIRRPFIEVDAHNIVPCRAASSKQEYAAYTIRSKIHRRLPEFLEPFPEVLPHPVASSSQSKPVDWDAVLNSLRIDPGVKPVDGLKPGENAAAAHLQDFIERRLARYDSDRNDPTKEGQSGLSPYLHFGQISAQRVVLDVESAETDPKLKSAFIEELIVRRELSDNYCFYNPAYDTLQNIPNWALQTLNNHRNDPRPYIYTQEQFEQAETHDSLWNAAQLEMVKTGKMHGYMRMYWAKKILEWTPSPEEAMRIAIHLNDRYSLDGRDPNGYAGIAWCIAGVHDRAWFERSVFGKIRYMSESGARRKFDVKKYIEKFRF